MPLRKKIAVGPCLDVAVPASSVGYSTRGVVCSCILCRPSAFIKFLRIKYLWENYFNCINFFPLQSSSDVSFTTPQQLKQFFIIVPSKLRLVTLAAFLLWKKQKEVLIDFCTVAIVKFICKVK